jgi:hypothetical protein
MTEEQAPAEKPGIWARFKAMFKQAKESEAAEKAGDMAEKAWDKTKDAAGKAWEKTKDAAEDVKEFAEEKIEDIRHKDEADEEGEPGKAEDAAE